MAFRDDLLRVLSGGIGSLVDGEGGGGGQATTTQPVEERPPEPQLQDRTNYGGGGFLQNVTQTQILLGTAAILGLLGVVYVARRM